MKIDAVRITGASAVDLPLRGVTSASPFLLKAADGLGPPEVEVFMSKTRGAGRVYQDRQAQNREPTLLVGLQPEWRLGQTPEELRTTLYGLLTPKYGRMVKMEVLLGNQVLAFDSGHVKKIEPSLFVGDPEVQIVLSCLNSYLFSPTSVSSSPLKTAEGGSTYFTVENIGSAPSGFQLQTTFTVGTVGTLEISDDDPEGEVMRIDHQFTAGDTFRLDTRPGTRGVWKRPLNAVVETPLLNALNPFSKWMQLHSGANRLRINNTQFDWGNPGVLHTPAYWGV